MQVSQTASRVSKPPLSAPELSQYLDSRQFLNDFYEFKRHESKGARRPYSYATFSAAAGIKSPNYLKMIIEGKRNLSEEMAFCFAKALRFSKTESLEFVTLVQYTQAQNASDRNAHLRKLASLRVQKKIESGEIDRAMWDKVPGWVAYALHAMIPPTGMAGEVAKLYEHFRGKAQLSEIDMALQALIRSGLVEQNNDDLRIYKRAEFMDDLARVPPALIRKLQAELIGLSLESLERDPPHIREMGSLTLSLSDKEFEEVRFHLRKLRKLLMKDYLTKPIRSAAERVFQIQLQIFPLTDVIESKLEREKEASAEGSSSESTEFSTGPETGPSV